MTRRLLVLVVAVLALTATPAHATGPTAVAIGADGRVTAGWTRADGTPVVSRDGASIALPMPEAAHSSAFVGDGLFAGPDGTVAVWRTATVDLTSARLGSSTLLRAGVPGGRVADLATRGVVAADAAADANGRVLVAWDGPGEGSAWVAPDGTTSATGAPKLRDPAVAVAGTTAVIAGQACPSTCDVEVWTSDGGPWTLMERVPGTAATADGDARSVAIRADGRIVLATPKALPAKDAALRYPDSLVLVRPAGATAFGPAQTVGPGARVEPGFVAFRAGDHSVAAPVGADGALGAPVPFGAGDAGLTTASAADGRGLVGLRIGSRPAIATVATDGTIGAATPVPKGGSGTPPAFALGGTADRPASAAAWQDDLVFQDSEAWLSTSGLEGQAPLDRLGVAGFRGYAVPTGPPALPPGGRAIVVQGKTLRRVAGQLEVPIYCRDACVGDAIVRAGGRRRVRDFLVPSGGTATVRVPVSARARRARVTLLSSSRRTVVRRRISTRAPAGACGLRATTSAVLRRGRVRLLREERPEPANTYDDDQSPSTVLYACRAGRAKQVAALYADDNTFEDVVGAAIAGSRVAVVTETGGGRDPSYEWHLSTRDVRSGRQAFMPIARAQEGTFQRAFLRVAVGADGSVAILDRVSTVDRVRVLALQPRALFSRKAPRQTVLDAAPGIDPARLAVRGGTVHWWRDGVERTAVAP